MIQISTWIITLFLNGCGQECETTAKTNLPFASFILQLTPSMLGSKVQLAPPMENIFGKATILTSKLDIYIL